ncbi:hypothetical protein WBG78_24755 [Chryseolinea sp. T2]|uniref:hypothetical protein n=1 Tax=Chryseolinea sp. T2 TaxID=3129255 RepID=UPI003077449C
MKLARAVTLAFCLVQLTIPCSLAQSNQDSQGTFEILKQPANAFPQTLSWWDSIYMFRNFQPGRITYFTGFTPQQQLKLNYNLYYGQMDLIEANGDTSQLEALKTIRSIEVGNDVFYYFPKIGYLHVLVQGDIVLAAHTMLHLYSMDRANGYAVPSNLAAGGDVRGRPSTVDKYYINASAYYFLDEERQALVPAKNVLTKMFSEHKEGINEFVKTHSTNFNLEKDLLEVVEYCNSLRRLSSGKENRMVVRANELAFKILRDSIYRFNEFQDGTVVYQDGKMKTYGNALNYNRLSGDLEAIVSNDTLKASNSDFISTCILGSTTFLKRPEGFIEIVLNGPVSVGVVRKLALVHSQSPSASVKKNIADNYNPSQVANNIADYDREFAAQNQYYLIDTRGQIHLPSSSALYRIYPDQKKQIDQYIKAHQPDLRNESDLKLIISRLESK